MFQVNGSPLGPLQNGDAWQPLHLNETNIDTNILRTNIDTNILRTNIVLKTEEEDEEEGYCNEDLDNDIPTLDVSTSTVP